MHTPPEPRPTYIDFTPELAAQWLSRNTVNRTLRHRQVALFAREMTAGRWTTSNDAICVSPTGELLNGQHRLNAIIKADKTVRMLVLYGVDPNAMSNMDSGAKRSAADHYGFKGEHHSVLLAASLKVALLYSDGRLYRDSQTHTVSVGEMDAFLNENPDIRRSVSYISAHARPVDMTPTSKAVAHWIMARAAGVDEADRFFHLLSTRHNQGEGSPLLALDNRLRQVRRDRVRVSRREEIHLAVRVWNLWRQDRTVKSVSVRTKSALIPEASR